MSHILIIEDDQSLGKSLSSLLQSDGHQIDLATNLSEASGKLDHSKPDMIILDWMLPDGQGIDYLKNLRKSDSTTPVIMLTARADLIDKILGLETGANDYMTKPFEPRELMARIRVQLRDKKSGPQENPTSESSLVINNLEISLERREVLLEKKIVELTKMEFDLLTLLAISPNKAFSREEILNKVWGFDNYPTTRTVDTHILQIRQKFPDLNIETIRGIGYRLKS